MLYTKGESVKYTAGDKPILAVVRTRHFDGTATVEARYHLGADGRICGPYLGFKYRLPVSQLRYAV